MLLGCHRDGVPLLFALFPLSHFLQRHSGPHLPLLHSLFFFVFGFFLWYTSDGQWGPREWQVGGDRREGWERARKGALHMLKFKSSRRCQPGTDILQCLLLWSEQNDAVAASEARGGTPNLEEGIYVAS